MTKQQVLAEWQQMVNSGDLRQAIGLFLLEFGNPEMTIVETQEIIEGIFNLIVGVKNDR